MERTLAWLARFRRLGVVAARDVDFVLLGGDLAYSNGDPRLVAREEAWFETVANTLVTPGSKPEPSSAISPASRKRSCKSH